MWGPVDFVSLLLSRGRTNLSRRYNDRVDSFPYYKINEIHFKTGINQTHALKTAEFLNDFKKMTARNILKCILS